MLSFLSHGKECPFCNGTVTRVIDVNLSVEYDSKTQ